MKGLINIAVFDSDGASSAILHPDSAIPLLPPQRDQRAVFRFGPEAALTFPSGRYIILVLFDPAKPAPASLSAHAVVAGRDPILNDTAADATFARVQVRRATLTAAAEIDAGGALSGWYATLPLYIFIVLGPRPGGRLAGGTAGGKL